MKKLLRRDDPVEVLIGELRQARERVASLEDALLLAIVDRTRNGAPGEQYLTVDEYASRTRHHPQYVYRLVREGEIPHRRQGRSIRIPVSALANCAS
jgi:excisionase family DNA binding protein